MAEEVPRDGPDMGQPVDGALAKFTDSNLIAFGRKLQAKRDELESERKKLKTALDQITGELLVRFNREKKQNVRTEAGLAYISEVHTTKITDREAFLENVVGICEDAMKVSVDPEWLAAWKLDNPNETFPGTETTTVRRVNLRS